MGAFCLLLSLATGVDYGWMPEADGSLTYLIQLEPELVAELQQPGFAIESVIPDDLRGVRRFKIYVGQGEVPRIGAPHAAVQAQWSQYVETPPGSSGIDYLNRYVPPNDPYGVANEYLPPPVQSPVWRDQAVSRDGLYSWSELAQTYLSTDPNASGSSAPPLTLPPGFEGDIAKLPGDVWNQATQTLRDRGLDPSQLLPDAQARLQQEFQQGVASANAAVDRFGDRLASEADRTIGAWTGTDITRSATPAAASSPVGSSGGAFAAAPSLAAPTAAAPSLDSPTVAQSSDLRANASSPMTSNPTNAGGLGMPSGPAFSAPAAAAGTSAQGRPGEFAPAPTFGGPSNLNGPSAAGGPLAGSLAGGNLSGGNSLDAAPSGGALAGGSSLDAPPLAGAPLSGGALGGSSSLDAPPGGAFGGAAAGNSLDAPPASSLGGAAGGSLGGGGSSLDAGTGSLAGGGSSLGGGTGALGGSLDAPPIEPGENPFGAPQIGDAANDNPFGVPIVARSEVPDERRTLPYSAIPVRPDFDSELLAGPPAIDVTATSAAQPGAGWNWGSTVDSEGRPWGPLFVTAVILFLSVGLNCYLAWIAKGLYERYKNLIFSRRHAPTSAAT